jgi:hypothetical protein
MQCLESIYRSLDQDLAFTVWFNHELSICLNEICIPSSLLMRVHDQVQLHFYSSLSSQQYRVLGKNMGYYAADNQLRHPWLSVYTHDSFLTILSNMVMM